MKIQTKRGRAVVRAMVVLATELVRDARTEAEQIEMLELKRSLLRLVTEQRKENAR